MLDELFRDPLVGLSVLAAALVFIAPAIWFIYSAFRSIALAAKTMNAPRASSLQGAPSSRSERFQNLPAIPFPTMRYSRAHARFPKDEVPGFDTSSLLARFEDRVIASANPELFFTKLASTGSADFPTTSMVVGMNAGPGVRFLGWLTLREAGANWEWNLICSELRHSRTPSEDSSHFEHGNHQSQGLATHINNSGDDWVGSIWNIATVNFTTSGIAKKAEWFERLLKEMWVETLEEAANLVSTRPKPPIHQEQESSPAHPQTDSTEQPRRRPTRRD